MTDVYHISDLIKKEDLKKRIQNDEEQIKEIRDKINALHLDIKRLNYDIDFCKNDIKNIKPVD